jgi:hypothetical protein
MPPVPGDAAIKAEDAKVDAKALARDARYGRIWDPENCPSLCYVPTDGLTHSAHRARVSGQQWNL